MHSAGSFFKGHYKSIYMLLVILLVGLILRVYGISGQSYWFDEIVTIDIATQANLGSIITGSRPPLYLSLAYIWIQSFGTSQIATRLLSIIFGTLSIALIYIVGKTLFSQKVGIISAFFMSVSKFQIYYSQELRYYAIYEMLTISSFYFFIRFLRSKSNLYAALYAISTILVFYSHDIGIFILIAQNLYIVIRYKTFRTIIFKWTLIQTIIIICILPRFINSFLSKAIGESGPNWIGSVKVYSPIKTILNYLGIDISSFLSISFTIAIIFISVSTLIYFILIGTEKRSKIFNRSITSQFSAYMIRSETILVLLWLFVPMILLLIMSEIFKPMYLDRYIICSAPACYLLLALFLTKIHTIIPISIFLAAYLILISPVMYDYYTTPPRADWKQVVTYIQKIENDDNNKILVVISNTNYRTFKWHSNREFAYCLSQNKQINFGNKMNICLSMNLEVLDLDHFWLVVKENEKGGFDEAKNYQIGDRQSHIEKVKDFVLRKDKTATLYKVVVE